MCGNSFGDIFRITTFGESHGEAIGCIIDGCPSLLEISAKYIQQELDRRKPGQNSITTPRDEDDKVEILSGVFDGKTTGTPICLIIKNKNHHSGDYNEIKDIFRCGHADYTYQIKYGIRDYRGGGRSSARETACRVACGAIAKKYLKEQANIDILAYTNSIYNIECNIDENKITKEMIEKNITRCPDDMANSEMIKIIEEMKEKGNSVGGSIRCLIKNCPAGLGEPVFDKLSAKLAQAMMSINAVKGFEIGEGFKSSYLTGEENNDEFYNDNGVIKTKTNHCGGILGGISNGQNIDFTTYFKPIATIKTKQHTITKDGDNIDFQITKGRHDPCAVPRAVPVVEAMTAITIMDLYLKNKRFK